MILNKLACLFFGHAYVAAARTVNGKTVWTYHCVSCGKVKSDEA